MNIRPLRSLLLAASESRWLRQRAPRLPFIRHAVTRFMPGETLEDALGAAAELRTLGISTVFTELGENVSDAAQADAVTRHYMDALTKIAERGLDCHISVKLTQLGLDIDAARCLDNVRALATRAQELNTVVWIDMEQHTYVDATLKVYRTVLAEHPNIGVCLQSYLYRTAKDLDGLIPLGPPSQRFGGASAVRLVKGAYREPSDVAYPKKRDVDDNFLALAKAMVGPAARASGFRAVFGTHDSRLINAIHAHLAATGQPRDAVEFHLLFGIQRAEQLRLAREGYRVRVLISYGEHWFPWYMRRLAERPANVLFVVKSIVSRSG
jgi:proline dehydrogenase